MPGKIEINLFGRNDGYGESILIHTGFNEWIIVDSCIDPISNEPAALQYIKTKGVDPKEAVKLIVATHWHDDHVRGLGKIFHECEHALFARSFAFGKDDFFKLVEYGKKSGVKEFGMIHDLLDERYKKNKLNKLEFAIANKLLWKSSGSEVHSLSPSSYSVQLAWNKFSDSLTSVMKNKNIRTIHPNHAAVVLWIKIGGKSILLGSDLQETGNPNTGWSVIINSDLKPDGRAEIFKIPHHGAASADHPEVWSAMLIKNTLAIMTPFKKGGNPLPKTEDARRILERTPNAFITSSGKHPPIANADFGHIRLTDDSTRWNVELFGGATHLTNFLKSP